MASFNLSDWTYTPDTTNQTYTLTAYNGTDTDIYIPGLYTDTDGNSYQIILGGFGIRGTSAIFPRDLTTLTIAEVNGVKVKLAITDLSRAFDSSTGLTSIDLSGLDTSNVTNMKSMFQQCTRLTDINLTGFDTSNVTDMSYMFYECYNLTSLDLSSFNTQNVNDMSYMFYECYLVQDLDLSNFNTENVTDMSYMFYWCGGLTTLDLSSFNTSKVTNMSRMFQQCSNLTSVDVSSFDTSNVTDMSSMFYNCISLTTLDLSYFDTSNVTDMNHMFWDCDSLTELIVSSFNTSNVTDMNNMFYNCSSLSTLDVSSFDTSKVTDMTSMFQACSGLVALDLKNFDTTNVTSADSLFSNCSKLGIVDATGATLNDDALTSFYTIGLDTPLIILSDDSTIANHDWTSRGQQSLLTFNATDGEFPETSSKTETYRLNYVYADADALLAGIKATVDSAKLPIEEYCVFIEWDLEESTSTITPSTDNTKELLDLYHQANGTYDAVWLKIYNDLNLWKAVYEAVGEPLTIPNVAALITLDAPNRDIRDLTGIEYCKSLEYLNLSDNPLYKVDKLETLTTLLTLKLDNVYLRDTTPLKNLTNLTTLKLNDNYIENLYPLSKLTNLETLEMENNQITDICQLRKLTNLETLNLASNEISDISTLSKLTNVKTLNLDDNRISDLSALGSLTDLTSLSVANQRIILQFRTVPTLKHTLRAKSPFVKPDGTNMLLIDPGSKNPYTYDEMTNLISWTEALTTKKGTRISKVNYSPITVGNVTTTYSAHVTQHYAEWIPLRLHFRNRTLSS